MSRCLDRLKVESADAILAVGDDGCSVILQRPEDMAPGQAIVQYTEAGKVEIRDGSQNYPIVLKNLEKQIGGTIDSIIIRDGSGKLKAFSPSTGDCLDYKLISRNGLMSLVPDTLPSILEQDVCEVSSCEEFDYFLGLKEQEVSCDGDTIVFLKLVKVPKTVAITCEDA